MAAVKLTKKNPQDIEVDRLLADWGIGYTAAYDGEKTRGNNWKCDAWRVSFTATEGSKGLTTDFYTGLGWRVPDPRWRRGYYDIPYDGRKEKIPNAPTAAGVLYSLLSDARYGEETFPDFCANCGYDEASRKALATYLQCQSIGQDLRRMFTHEQRAELEHTLENY